MAASSVTHSYGVRTGANPWADTDILSGINLGHPEKALTLARQFGIEIPSKHSSNQPSVSQNMSAYIEALKNLSALHRAMNEVELNIHLCELNLRHASLLSQDTIVKRLKMTAELLDHLSLVLEKKDLILDMLKATTSAECVSVEAPYHKYLHRALSSVPSLVHGLPLHLRSLQSSTHLQPHHLTTLMEHQAAGVRESLSLCETHTRRCMSRLPAATDP